MTAPQQPTPAGVLPIAETAVRLLQGVVDWYADEDNEATELPTRRYVAAGDPRTVAWDGPQVTVSVSSLPLNVTPSEPNGSTQAGRRMTAGRLIRSVAYELQVVRCYPGWDPSQPEVVPSAEQLMAAGLDGMTDLQQIVRCLTKLVSGGALVAEGHPPPQVLLGAVETLGPDGGLTAVAATITVAMT